MSFTHETLIGELPKLEKFARKLCRNEHDAEDLLQATVLKALEKKDMFEEGSNLFSWTSKIMYNDFVSGYRRRVKFETQYDCSDFIANQSVKAHQDDILTLNEINEAMQELSDEHQTILVCVCVKGMKYQEVSEMLGLPVGTVRSRLSRAREQLQALINDSSRLQHGKKSTPPTPLRQKEYKVDGLAAA